MAKKKKMKKEMKEKMKEEEFWCFCCKEKVKAKSGSICLDMYKNGSYALRGKCCLQNCSMSKFISDDNAAKWKSKYNDCQDDDSDGSNKIAEAGGILAFLALLGGAIAYAVKTSKC